MSEFKQKSLTGLKWSFADAAIGHGLTLIFGIVLARILSPREFGLLGMITIFVSISVSLSDSGFTSALIRKTNCTDRDYSTVFFYNLSVAFALWLMLFFTAPSIAAFFGEPELTMLIKVLSFVIVIEAAYSIQRTLFIKRVDFRTQTKISLVASVISGAMAITMALRGMGVWSLVALQLSRAIIYGTLLWLAGKWQPSWVFSKSAFKELFAFGNNMMISGLIDTAYANLYSLVIGKFFSAGDLGNYSRAVELRNLPSKNLLEVIERVSYPTLAEFKDDIPTFRMHLSQYLRSTCFVSFHVLLGLAALAPNLIEILLGLQWRDAGIYLQLLSLVGLLLPMQIINLSMLKIMGRSDVILKLNLFLRLITIPFIVAGVFLGIKIMIGLMAIGAAIIYLRYAHWAERLVGYGLHAQLRDLWPSMAMALSVALLAYLPSLFLPLSVWLVFPLQLLVFLLSFLLLGEWRKNTEYLYLKAQLPYLMNRK